MNYPDENQTSQDQPITEPCSTENEGRDEGIQCMPIAGPCSVSGCSCGSFVVKSSTDAQWCENCGHSRSKHM